MKRYTINVMLLTFLLVTVVSIGLAYQSSITNRITALSEEAHLLNASFPHGSYTVTNHFASGDKVILGTAAFNEHVPLQSKDLSDINPPLSENLTTFEVDNTILFLLGNIDSGDRNRLWDPYTSFDEIGLWDTDLGNSPEAAVGDFDGDGCDEILVTGYNGYDARIWDDNNTDFVLLHTFSVLDEENEVAKANVDNDLSDEILILGKSGSSIIILVCDDAESVFIELAQIVITVPVEFTGTPTLNYGRLTSGNIDSDPMDEIIVLIQDDTNSHHCLQVFDDALASFAFIGEQYVFYYDCQDMVALDADLDGVDEIVLNVGKDIRLYGDITNTFSLLGEFAIANVYSHVADLRLAKGNFDDTMGEDIAILYRNTNSNNVLCFLYGYVSLDLYYINTINLGSESSLSFSNLCINNFDYDLNDEIAITHTLWSSDKVKARVFDDFEEDFTELANREYDISATPTVHPTVISGDFSGKITLQYVHHNCSDSMPQIIAAISAPPTVSGIKQVYDFSATIFGQSVAGSSSTSNGYSISTGVTLSFEKDDILGIFGVKISAQLSYEFAMTKTTTKTETQCVEYSASNTDDSIIFQKVTYDNYFYEVLTHPNSTHIGEWMAFSVPQEVIVYKWVKSFYNQQYANYHPIGDETFNHTAGLPWTYLTKEQKDLYLTKYENWGIWQSAKMTVGAGDAVNSVGISLATEQTTEVTRTISVDFEAGFSVFGIGLTLSVGFSTSSAYTITIEENTSYEGVVGDIDERYYQYYNYSFGLLVYNTYRNDTTIRYQVINYWVEDYNGPLYGQLFVVDNWWFWVATSGCGALVLTIPIGSAILVKKRKSLKEANKTKSSKEPQMKSPKKTPTKTQTQKSINKTQTKNTTKSASKDTTNKKRK
ncbi:MAG: hypothetical protein JXA54_11750 [Candidatus Heimdallarchaeota archaeon]|nr:hypothetical protein [Candidatus Heimdallarchaeota archaeon]